MGSTVAGVCVAEVTIYWEGSEMSCWKNARAVWEGERAEWEVRCVCKR